MCQPCASSEHPESRGRRWSLIKELIAPRSYIPILPRFARIHVLTSSSVLRISYIGCPDSEVVEKTGPPHFRSDRALCGIPIAQPATWPARPCLRRGNTKVWSPVLPLCQPVCHELRIPTVQSLARSSSCGVPNSRLLVVPRRWRILIA